MGFRARSLRSTQKDAVTSMPGSSVATVRGAATEVRTAKANHAPATIHFSAG